MVNRGRSVRDGLEPGVDPGYLLSMLHVSWMSRPNNVVVPGGKMGLAMQLIFTPMILRLMGSQTARWLALRGGRWRARALADPP
jgi:hypothetical protein